MLETVLRLLMHRAILYEGGLLFSKNYSNEKREFFMKRECIHTRWRKIFKVLFVVFRHKNLIKIERLLSIYLFSILR